MSELWASNRPAIDSAPPWHQRGSAPFELSLHVRVSRLAGNPSIGPRHQFLYSAAHRPYKLHQGMLGTQGLESRHCCLSSAAVSISDNVIFDTWPSYHVATSPGSLIPPASNILRNVGIFTQAHGSGLPSDSTPAVFRLNPGTGIVSGNRACGSESHGFWIGFDVLDVGAGDPKFTSAVAPGAFDNNEADTSAGAGFFVSQLDPRADGDIPGARIATTLASCIAWGNAEGGVMVGSALVTSRLFTVSFLRTDSARQLLVPPHADRWWSAST